MIEREFIKQKAKYLKIQEYLENAIPKGAGAGKITIEKTPMGEKIIINAVRPGLIIGRGGKTITDLTNVLKNIFKLENPQIEVQEVDNPYLNATIVARRIAADLERFGSSRFKVVGYKALQGILNSGAFGAELRITGRGLPSQKARSWRFFGGYMKKCGDAAVSGIDSAQSRANLRSGTIGIKVSIMPPDIALPDKVKIHEVKVEEVAVKAETLPEQPKEEAKTKKKKTQSKTEKVLAEPKAPRKKKKEKPVEKKEEEKIEEKQPEPKAQSETKEEKKSEEIKE